MSLDGSGEGLPTPAPLGEAQASPTSVPKPPRWHLGENKLKSFLDGLRGNQAPSSINVHTPEPPPAVTPREAPPPPSNTRRV